MHNTKSPRLRSRFAVKVTEVLERRLLLSGTDPVASYPLEYNPPGSSITPLVATAPFTPANIRHFYGVDQLTLGVNPPGFGETIAIIDAYNQPNIASDLSSFDNDFGLAAPPSFKIENETGGTTLPANNTGSGSVETSLDVEWAHAMAPGANILLVECNSLSYSDLVQNGVTTANNTAGVAVVTMSFGAPDFSGESFYDQYFNHTGITYFASAGDDGAAYTLYPATSPYVVAVGGTAITTSDSAGSYGSEVVWNNTNDGDGATGGAISTQESKPTYQTNVTQSSTKRTAPDISLEASPDTGVYVYDTPQGGLIYPVGGTSLSSPCWAGLVADADQYRGTEGLTAMSGYTPSTPTASQTLSRLYQLPSSAFHDITSGNNNYENTGGNNAGVGYDLATGIGTPVANKLIPDLAGGASVTGHVFVDQNTNGILDGTESPVTSVAYQSVYLDLNNNGVQDSNEPTTTINASGGYVFSSLVTGGDLLGGLTGTVRLSSGTPSGYVLVGTGSTFTTAYDTTTIANVGLFPTVFTVSTGAANGDAWVVRTSPTSSTTLQILIDGAVAYTAPLSILSGTSLSFTFTVTRDSLAVDFGNGNPLPSGGLSVNGSSLTNGFALSVLGTSGNDTIAVTGSAVTFGSNLITYSNVASLSIDPRGGTDSLTVTGAAITVPGATGGILDRQFSTLSLASSAKVTVAAPDVHTDRTVLAVNSLSVDTTSMLDLTGNDMDISGSNLSTVNHLVATAYAFGNWTGLGITSSTAAADTTRTTAVAVIQNNQDGTPLFSSAKTFDGLAPNPGDVLVKFTYVGDANLSGAVDGSDYGLIDAGYASAGGLTGWLNGDFNYDGVVDGTDYTLIDNTFNNQQTALPSAVVAAEPSATVAAPVASTGYKTPLAPKTRAAVPRLTARFVPPSTTASMTASGTLPAATAPAGPVFSDAASLDDLLFGAVDRSPMPGTASQAT
jgi:hypothetical protein